MTAGGHIPSIPAYVFDLVEAVTSGKPLDFRGHRVPEGIRVELMLRGFDSYEAGGEPPDCPDGQDLPPAGPGTATPRIPYDWRIQAAAEIEVVCVQRRHTCGSGVCANCATSASIVRHARIRE